MAGLAVQLSQELEAFVSQHAGDTITNLICITDAKLVEHNFPAHPQITPEFRAELMAVLRCEALGTFTGLAAAAREHFGDATMALVITDGLIAAADSYISRKAEIEAL